MKRRVVNWSIVTCVRDVRAAIFPVAAGTHPPSRTPLCDAALVPQDKRRTNLPQLKEHYGDYMHILCSDISILIHSQRKYDGYSDL